MNPTWDHLTGVMIVKDQAHLAPLTILSTMGVCDDYLLVDNGSTDGTREALETVVGRYGLKAHITEREGYVGDLFLEALHNAEDFVLRLEGDQVFFEEELRALVTAAERETTVKMRSIMLRNRLDLQNREWPVNAAHPTLYHCDGSHEMLDGKLWPRSLAHKEIGMEDPASVNCRVHTPTERLKRWHRPQWWRWGSREIEDHMELEDYEMPYQNHMGLEEYIWLLRERGKGSAEMGWEGETLDEIGRAYIEADIREMCQYYAGPYPRVLQAFIDETVVPLLKARGYGAGVYDV